MVPLENVLYLQSNQNNVTECLASSIGVCSHKLCRCWTFLKANEFPGFRTCSGGLWTCAPSAGGPLHEVFCTGSAFTCAGSVCFADTVVTGVEGVVVLKGVASSGTVGVVLESYWHCTALHLFCMLFNIWNTFDIPFDVPLTVPFRVHRRYTI